MPETDGIAMKSYIDYGLRFTDCFAFNWICFYDYVTAQDTGIGKHSSEIK